MKELKMALKQIIKDNDVAENIGATEIFKQIKSYSSIMFFRFLIIIKNCVLGIYERQSDAILLNKFMLNFFENIKYSPYNKQNWDEYFAKFMEVGLPFLVWFFQKFEGKILIPEKLFKSVDYAFLLANINTDENFQYKYLKNDLIQISNTNKQKEIKTNKLIEYKDSNRMKFNEEAILDLNYGLDTFPTYLSHPSKDALADKIRTEFSIGKGKKIRLLIEVLKSYDPPLLFLLKGENMKFYKALKEYFARDIGTYQGIFNCRFNPNEEIDNADMNNIMNKLTVILENL